MRGCTPSPDCADRSSGAAASLLTGSQTGSGPHNEGFREAAPRRMKHWATHYPNPLATLLDLEACGNTIDDLLLVWSAHGPDAHTPRPHPPTRSLPHNLPHGLPFLNPYRPDTTSTTYSSNSIAFGTNSSAIISFQHPHITLTIQSKLKPYYDT
ncbi:hypothetical protein E2C01_058452 [Portunus trituberculatus]|uniref:Uncharacterized protein n=1 Tax=Portunus trituberculatus TaxID=210409 RepID=A0A5B7H314_PORTR|nr:hypothetical protein [Portunus trituberculatus]